MRSRFLPISSALRDRAFPGLHVSGEMRFSAREYKPKGHLRSICALSETGSMDRPLVRDADYTSKWKVTHWKSVNTRAFELSRRRDGRCGGGLRVVLSPV